MIRKLLQFLTFALLAILPIRGKKETVPGRPSPESNRESAVKRWFGTAAVLLGVLATGGLLLVLSGAVPIKASSRHWAITSWFLNFAKERSVATHTLGKKVPSNLDSPLLLLKGATHYETGCSPCHGSPSMPQPRIPHGMTPPPPPLQHIRSKFDANELFYIVKHGIKFTGMPAWPAANRDDEVWAVVAFLRSLPNMDAREYQRLAIGNGENSKAESLGDMTISGPISRIVEESCSRCHGADGLGRGLGAAPRLAGQKPEYILGSLQAYASGRRSSGIMQPIAHALNIEQRDQLARYYSELSFKNPHSGGQNENAIERGRTIARNGIPSQRVPACVECHGPGTTPRNEMYPRLSGQYAAYLLLQLELFKAKTRGGTAYSHLMHFVAGGLTPEQMSDVAQYFASLANEDGKEN